MINIPIWRFFFVDASSVSLFCGNDFKLSPFRLCGRHKGIHQFEFYCRKLNIYTGTKMPVQKKKTLSFVIALFLSKNKTRSIIDFENCSYFRFIEYPVISCYKSDLNILVHTLRLSECLFEIQVLLINTIGKKRTQSQSIYLSNHFLY